jgi:hypothetical protein
VLRTWVNNHPWPGTALVWYLVEVPGFRAWYYLNDHGVHHFKSGHMMDAFKNWTELPQVSLAQSVPSR